LPDNVDPITTEVLAGVDLPFLGTRRRGKVRDLYELGDRLIMVATDRLSAFDRILGLVPHKGQVLTQLAAFWFQHTRDLVGNALLEVPDPNVTVARLCRPLAVEVVVRGFITGVTSTSLWQRYSLGDREIYGIRFPDGLSKNDALSEPIITPTTKAADGSHDERITAAQVVKQGIATSEQWDAIARAAVAVFRRGQEIAARGGLILVDTKYEFGVTPEGEVVLIDEIHTPDSSRFWVADTMQARILSGHEPENFDKEFVRLYYAERGYRGEGEPFALPNALADEASRRYIAAYERITGASFVPAEQPANARIERSLREWLSRHEGTGS
jgi:phosphoribosylaminoimidazole-succinocarboxamide synthase